jgi:hypothetical protein
MRGRFSWPVAAPVLVPCVALSLATACGGTPGANPAGTQTATAAAAPGPPMTRCGTTRTAAGVPVEIEIKPGSVACTAALAVERDYARALASGKVPGNGGGAPATVRGWVCRGFTTPEVLATGHTSSCRKGGAQILAVLQMPSTSASSP